MDLWPRVLSPSHNSKKALDLRNHLWPSGNRTVSPEAGLFPSTCWSNKNEPHC